MRKWHKTKCSTWWHRYKWWGSASLLQCTLHVRACSLMSVYSALSLSGTTPRHLWWPTTDRDTHKHSLNEQPISYICTYVHTYIHMHAIAVSYVCEIIPAPQLLRLLSAWLGFCITRIGKTSLAKKLLDDVGGTRFTELSDTDIVQQMFG